MTIKDIVCKTLLIAIPLAGAQATTFYVSTGGSDSNPGTSAQPFRTITYAYSKASSGTTILVAPGVYTDYQSGWGLHLGRSGTASSPIVLQSQVAGQAVIDGQNASDRNQAIYLDGSYNVVQGFEIRNGPNGGISIWGNGNKILSNQIHNNGNPASSSSNGHDGVYDDQTTSGNIYIGNYVHDNGRTGGSNLDHGLYVCGSNEQVINNVLLRNDASGLQVAGYDTVSNLKVYNNVMAWNGTSGIILWMSLSGIDIKNNIIYQNGHYGVGTYAATGSGVVLDHNLFYGNGYGSYDLTVGGSTVSYSVGTVLSSDPRLVNESSSGFDAHLAAGSPAIGAGLNLSSVFTTDMAGQARPSSGAWDLGAYIYGQSVDTTPPNISITAPANNAKVSGTITVTASASDNVGVASVQFTWDGANLGNALTAAPYTMSLNTVTASNGSHTLGALAQDAAGNQATATPVTILVSNTTAALPSVTVAATISNASRVGPTNGVFTFTRSGSTTAACTVSYSLAGTASNGADYTLLGTSLTIPAGVASAALTVKPLPSASYVDSETVTLALSANPAYTVGSTSTATVTLAGNRIPCALDKAPGNNIKITWASVAGKIYRVACKTNLSDPMWTNLSGLLTASGPTTSYTDTAASRKTQRFYLVYVTN